MLFCLDVFALVAAVILILYLGYRWMPLVMSDSKRQSFLAGLVGGAVGALAGLWWDVGPKVGHLSLPLFVAGALLAILSVGIAPFLRIMLVGDPLSRR
jgi:hypothetical protein